MHPLFLCLNYFFILLWQSLCRALILLFKMNKSLLGCSDKSGFRVDLIDNNGPDQGETVSKCLWRAAAVWAHTACVQE